MDHIDTISRAPVRAFDKTPELHRDPDKRYSPGDFLRQLGAVMAVCLGLALVAHVLVRLAGPY